MTLPLGLGTLPLPDWMPGWMPALLLVPLIVYLLLVLLVPFSTFGLRSRLEAIEMQLDDIRQDVRALALRLPAPMAEELPPVRRPERLGPGRAAADEARGRPLRGPAERAEPRMTRE
jgi:hypothetical protein